MSKAFDRVNCSKLMEILKNILTSSELQMMYLLINNVILNEKIGDKGGTDILKVIGIYQSRRAETLKITIRSYGQN